MSEWVIFGTGGSHHIEGYLNGSMCQFAIWSMLDKARCWAELLDCIVLFAVFCWAASTLTSAEPMGTTGPTFFWRVLTWQEESKGNVKQERHRKGKQSLLNTENNGWLKLILAVVHNPTSPHKLCFWHLTILMQNQPPVDTETMQKILPQLFSMISPFKLYSSFNPDRWGSI